MAVKEEKKEINGRLFLVQQMPAKRAFKNKLKILKVLGIGIKDMTGGIEKMGADTVLSAIGDALNNLDVDFASDLIFEFIESAQLIEGEHARKVTVDGDFSGNIEDMIPVFAFALQVNYREMVERLGKLIASVAPQCVPKKK